MIPRIDTPDQVREAISFMRYPPDGTRGLALSTRGAGLGERTHADVRSINPHVLGIIQIESPSAVEHAAEIAAIDGVDVLFVGPADLSHSLGVPGRFDDAGYLEAIAHVATVAEAAGKAAGILLYDAGHRRAASRARLPVHRARCGRAASSRAARGRSCGRDPRGADLLVGDAQLQSSAGVAPPPVRSGR